MIARKKTGELPAGPFDGGLPEVSDPALRDIFQGIYRPPSHDSEELLESFARRHPAKSAIRGGETFISIDVVESLIDEAEQQGLRILGMEGFIIGEATYPSITRMIAVVLQQQKPSR